jgi:hypothetical protein
MNIIPSFVNSRTSLIVEGVHLSVDLMMKIVLRFANVIPFLIYIKKEDFHRQRFAVRAKYMTTDPSVNRYIGHFSAIRTVQSYLSKDATQWLVPKIDNRNIDRSIETMHQTLFSYLKKLEHHERLIDTDTQRLTFLSSVWKRRKDKMTSKSKTIKAIKDMKEGAADGDPSPPAEDECTGMMAFLPCEGKHITGEEGDGIVYDNRTMRLLHEAGQADPPVPIAAIVPSPPPRHDGEPDAAAADSDLDPGEVTLTDFMSEQTDSDLVSDWRTAAPVPEADRAPIVPRKSSSQTS